MINFVFVKIFLLRNGISKIQNKEIDPNAYFGGKMTYCRKGKKYSYWVIGFTSVMVKFNRVGKTDLD